jgi:hypothetical protein
LASATFLATQQVTFRDHADELAALVDYRQSADAMLEHQVRRLFDWGIRTDACRAKCHHVSCDHSGLL